jgi:hypothetical protein
VSQGLNTDCSGTDLSSCYGYGQSYGIGISGNFSFCVSSCNGCAGCTGFGISNNGCWLKAVTGSSPLSSSQCYTRVSVTQPSPSPASRPPLPPPPLPPPPLPPPMASVTYSTGCASTQTTYGSSVNGTTFAVPISGGSCSPAGYAGVGNCCNGANAGTGSSWLGGSCSASTLPAVPILSLNSALGAGLFCLDVNSQMLVLTSCGTISNFTVSPTQQWSWTNSYGTNLYHIATRLCVQAVSLTDGSTLQLASCSASNLVGTLSSSATLTVGASPSALYVQATTLTPILSSSASGTLAQGWVSTCKSLIRYQITPPPTPPSPPPPLPPPSPSPAFVSTSPDYLSSFSSNSVPAGFSVSTFPLVFGPSSGSRGTYAPTGASLQLLGYSSGQTGISQSLGFAVYSSSNLGVPTCAVTFNSTSYPTAVMAIDSAGFLWLFACTNSICNNQTTVWNNLPASAPTGCVSSCTSTCNLTSTTGAGPGARAYAGSSGTLYLQSGNSAPQYIFGTPPPLAPPPPNVATVRCVAA